MNENQEKWVTIKKHPDYQVSDQGHIRRRDSQELKPFEKNKRGYKQVYFDGEQFYLHKLVAEAFIGEVRPGMVVHHINGNKSDSRAANLEITTTRRIFQAYHQEVRARNAEHSRRPRAVCQYFKGKLVATYRSSHMASRETGASQPSISYCCNGRLKTAHGFVWKFKNT